MKSKNYGIFIKRKNTVLNVIIDDIMKLYESGNDNFLTDGKDWQNHKPFFSLFK